MLKDPTARARYDALCPNLQLLPNIAIADEIDLADMHRVQSPLDGFQFPCRCGGDYVLDVLDIELKTNAIVVQCSTCSLYISILLPGRP